MRLEGPRDRWNAGASSPRSMSRTNIGVEATRILVWFFSLFNRNQLVNRSVLLGSRSLFSVKNARSEFSWCQSELFTKRAREIGRIFEAGLKHDLLDWLLGSGQQVRRKGQSLFGHILLNRDAKLRLKKSLEPGRADVYLSSQISDSELLPPACI